MGEATDYVGKRIVQVQHSHQWIALSQTKYMDSLIADFGLRDSSESQVPGGGSMYLSTKDEIYADELSPYRNLTGRLLITATHTRPGITAITSMLTRHVESPFLKHQRAGLKFFKYLKATLTYGLVLKSN